MKTVFKSPGVHTIEHDISVIHVPISKIRKIKISRILDKIIYTTIKNKE